MSRQERRAALKDGLKTIARRGIDLGAQRPERLWQVIACTKQLIEIFETRSSTRASDAARRAHEFFELSLKNNPPDDKIACAKGCGFCCHLRVTAMAPEVFHLANHIRRIFKGDSAAWRERVRAADAEARGLSGKDRAKRHIACGLLVDNACSMYAARPSACRALASLSVETCKRGFNGEDLDIFTPAVFTEIRGAQNQALWAALAHAQLASDGYELNHALLVALDTPDGEGRWLAGEDVFASVDRDAAIDMRDAEIKRRICERLIAGALGKELPPWEPI